MAISSIYEHARRTPERTALVYNHVSCSYAHFARCIEVTRQYLGQQGLPAGSVAVIDVGNMFDAWTVGLALRSLGLTTFVTSEPGDIASASLRNVSCVVRIAETPHGPGECSLDSRGRLISLPSDLARQVPLTGIPDVPTTSAHPGGHIMLTSGTTGANKKVLRDAATESLALPLHAEINAISERSIVYVANISPRSAGGYRWPLITWSAGGTVVMHQAPDLDVPLARHDISHFFTTPLHVAHVLNISKGKARRNDAMRLMVTGGAMTQALVAAAKQALTRQVYSVLASTEALTLGVTPIEQPDDLLWHRIHPSREVQIVDEADNVLGPGQEGSVRVRIIDGLTGYLDDEAATREFFRDGYFYPGDLGMFGEDGRLSLCGRASDVINVFGLKIATGPIERALQERLGVEGVCILCFQEAGAGEEIELVIEARRPIGTAELEAARNAAMGVLKDVPGRFRVIAKLPRNAMGKVARLELRRQLILLRAGAASA